MLSTVRFPLLVAVAAVAACSNGPVQPVTSPEVSAAKATTAPKCSDYRGIVAQLVSLVSRQTYEPTRGLLLADLNAAYAAMDPAACDAALATSHLRKFIADVNANASTMSPGLALTLVRVAESVIGYLAPFVSA